MTLILQIVVGVTLANLLIVGLQYLYVRVHQRKARKAQLAQIENIATQYKEFLRAQGGESEAPVSGDAG